MDDDELTSISLAAKGFGGGDPNAVMRMPVGTVLNLMNYVIFESDYVATKAHLNQPEGK